MKRKTPAEKEKELAQLLERILRVGSVHVNIKRNIESLRENRKYVRQLLNEAKKTRDPEIKKVLKMYSADYQNSINKLAGFIKEDVVFVRGELEDIRPKAIRKKKKAT